MTRTLTCPPVTASPAQRSRPWGLGLGIALALFIAVPPQTTLAQTTVAGVTAGALSVDETGSAGYTVPIAVPPGIAGLQPSVALVYKSHGGNGSLGVGWSLSAASSIHRCSQTLAQDGAIHGVDFSAQDRFCLDGQRLVAINGVYGADGTEYRTEIDGFARITSHGTAGTGPLSFTVESKSGQTLDYGNAADARLGVPGASEIRLWSLNRVTDPSGNAMTYHYIEDLADKSYRLDRIAYAYDAAVTTAKSEVRFLYEARPDIRTSYLAGAALALTRRLAKVETWTDTGTGLALVKDYRLTYELSPATDRSRITAITECDASNNCLQPVGLGWQGQMPGYSYNLVRDTWGMSDAHWDATKRKIHIVDYNGDGLSDILLQGQIQTHGSILLTNNSAGFDYSDVRNSWGMTDAHWAADRRELHVVDANGDGLSDLLLQGQTLNQGTLLLTNNGAGFDYSDVSYSWSMTDVHWAADRRELHILDANGDGLSDLLLQGQTLNQGTLLLTNNGAGFDYSDVSYSWSMTDVHWAADRRELHILDANGDGLSDLLLQGQTLNQGTLLLTNNGAGFDYSDVSYSWSMTDVHWAADRRELHILDANGDGLSDLLLQGQIQTHGTILLTNNGAGFDYSDVSNSWGMTNGHWAADLRQLHVVDVNGDDLSDLLLQGQIQTHGTILLTNTGAGFDYSDVRNSWGMTDGHWAADRRQIHVLEYQGDGLDDLLLQGQSGTEASVLLTNTGPAPDLLTSITDSLGRVSTLTYAPLTDDTVYTKDSDAVFPVVDIQAPLYVVKSVSSDDGLGGQKVTSYDYAGAKVHVQGRGFRGFRQMTATDQQTGIVTSTTYEQVFPYTAQVKSSVKTLADGTTVKTIANTWDQLSLNAGATVYPYVATSVSEDYEINDGIGNLPVVSRSATAVFDIYGNPTSLTTTTSGGGETFTETVANTYTNDIPNWFLGLLTRSEVTRSRGATP